MDFMLLTFLSRAAELGLAEGLSCPADLGGNNDLLDGALLGVVAALCSSSVATVLLSALEGMGARARSRRRSFQNLDRGFKPSEGIGGAGDDDDEGEVFVR
jgi:hypothetical protein